MCTQNPHGFHKKKASKQCKNGVLNLTRVIKLITMQTVQDFTVHTVKHTIIHFITMQ